MERIHASGTAACRLSGAGAQQPDSDEFVEDVAAAVGALADVLGAVQKSHQPRVGVPGTASRLYELRVQGRRGAITPNNSTLRPACRARTIHPPGASLSLAQPALERSYGGAGRERPIGGSSLGAAVAGACSRAAPTTQSVRARPAHTGRTRVWDSGRRQRQQDAALSRSGSYPFMVIRCSRALQRGLSQ